MNKIHQFHDGDIVKYKNVDELYMIVHVIRRCELYFVAMYVNVGREILHQFNGCFVWNDIVLVSRQQED